MMPDRLHSKGGTSFTAVSVRVQHQPVRLLQYPMVRSGPICSTLFKVSQVHSSICTDSIRAMQVDFGGQHTLLVVIDDSAPTSTAPAAAAATAGGMLLLQCKLSCIY